MIYGDKSREPRGRSTTTLKYSRRVAGRDFCGLQSYIVIFFYWKVYNPGSLGMGRGQVMWTSEREESQESMSEKQREMIYGHSGEQVSVQGRWQEIR